MPSNLEIALLTPIMDYELEIECTKNIVTSKIESKPLKQ